MVHNRELRWFLCSVGIMTVGITLSLYLSGHYPMELSFRKAFFQVATAHTSCGFASDDYMQWQPCTWVLLLMAMLSGGCTASTSGGIKCQRLVITRAGIRNHLYRLIHPNAILPLRVNGVSLSALMLPGRLEIFGFVAMFHLIGSGEFGHRGR